MPPQSAFETPDGRVLRNVSSATLTPYLPRPGTGNGTAVIVLPGGGFRVLAVELEGVRVAEALAARGVAAFVLQYRLQPTPVDPQAFKKEMDDFLAAVDRDAAPEVLWAPPPAVADLHAALNHVRESAADWGIDPARIGVMGFSAGAMTALTFTLKVSRSEVPAFVASIYGPMARMAAPSHVPPLFALMAADDPLFARKGFDLVSSWIGAGRPVEFHLLQAGGHGFGLGRPSTTTEGWIDAFERWLRMNRLMGE